MRSAVLAHHGSRRALLLTAALFAGLPVEAQPPATIDLAEFVVRLERLAAAVEQASRDEAARALDAAPPRMRVRTGAEDIDVSLDPLRESLGPRDAAVGWPERRQRLRERLHEMRAEAEARLHDRPPPLDLAGASLGAILTRREFTRRQSTWSTTAQRRLREWLRGLWRSVGGERVQTRSAALVLVSVATIAAIAGLIVWVARTTRRDAERAVISTPGVHAPPPTARGWAMRARDAAEAGDTREAVRCVYRAALKRLEEQGVWRIDEARTAREYVRLLHGGDARGDRVRDIVGQLERVVYANQAVAPADLARLTAHLEALGCVRAHERAI